MSGENQDSGQGPQGLRTPLSEPLRGLMDQSVQPSAFVSADDPNGRDPADFLPKPKEKLGVKVKRWWGNRRSPQNSPTVGEGVATENPVASQEQQPQICPYTLEQAAYLDYINAERLGILLLSNQRESVENGNIGVIRMNLLQGIPRALERREAYAHPGELLYQVERALFPLRISADQDITGSLPPDFYTILSSQEERLAHSWERGRQRETEYYQGKMADTYLTPEIRAQVNKNMSQVLTELLGGIDHIDPSVWGNYLEASSGKTHILAQQIPRELNYLRSLGINVDVQESLYQRKWAGLQKKAETLGPNFAIHPPLPVEN